MIKKIILLICFFLIPKNTLAWELDPGSPLYATATAKTQSQATYSEGPIYVGVDETVYFKAIAPESDMDTVQYEEETYYEYDSVSIDWSFGST